MRHTRANLALLAVDGGECEVDVDVNDVLVETAVLQRVRRCVCV